MKYEDEIITIKEHIEETAKAISQLCSDYIAYDDSGMRETLTDVLLDEIHKQGVLSTTLLYMLAQNVENNE